MTGQVCVSETQNVDLAVRLLATVKNKHSRWALRWALHLSRLADHLANLTDHSAHIAYMG